MERQLRSIGASLDGYTAEVLRQTEFPERRSLRLSAAALNRFDLITVEWRADPDRFEAAVSPPRGAETTHDVLVGDRPVSDAVAELLAEVAEALGSALAEADHHLEQGF